LFKAYLTPYGGASPVFRDLPPFFATRFSKADWVVPALSNECNALYNRGKSLEKIVGVNTK